MSGGGLVELIVSLLSKWFGMIPGSPDSATLVNCALEESELNRHWEFYGTHFLWFQDSVERF